MTDRVFAQRQPARAAPTAKSVVRSTPGDNATHWTTKASKFKPNASHAVPRELALRLIDVSEAKNATVSKE